MIRKKYQEKLSSGSHGMDLKYAHMLGGSQWEYDKTIKGKSTKKFLT